ncbi:MAG: SMP-30/gluconolactonase/LRE family protein [Alphaproteobacteria bacterium]|nr:SMP-30/gluconolactonase/LRE family protein [Alphaproteobacteria bacterium]
MSAAAGASSGADWEVWHAGSDMLGEGPIAHPERASVLWLDILGMTLSERGYGDGQARTHALGVMASAAALVDRRRVLLATEVDLRLFDLDTGAVETVMPFLAGRPDLRSNDARVHPSGAFWIGAMGKRAEPEAGAIWRYHCGALELLYERISIPNSIAFAADGRTAYFADSARRTIWRVDTDPATGRPSGDPSPFKVFAPGEGVPDGSVVDADGNLWNARWGGWSVDAWRPDGRRLDRCALPVSQPSCPVFFGKDLDGLLVTTARERMSAAAIAAEPLSGSVLMLRRAVRGVAEPRVRMA